MYDDYSYEASVLAGGISIVYSLIVIAISVVMLIGMWKAFQKANKPGWAAIIPVYNSYVLAQISFGNGWLFLLSFVPFVNFVYAIMLQFKLAKAFGKGTGFGFLLLFLPVIGYPMLGYSNSIYYIGPNGIRMNNFGSMPMGNMQVQQGMNGANPQYTGQPMQNMQNMGSMQGGQPMQNMQNMQWHGNNGTNTQMQNSVNLNKQQGQQMRPNNNMGNMQGQQGYMSQPRPNMQGQMNNGQQQRPVQPRPQQRPMQPGQNNQYQQRPGQINKGQPVRPQQRPNNPNM